MQFMDTHTHTIMSIHELHTLLRRQRVFRGLFRERERERERERLCVCEREGVRDCAIDKMAERERKRGRVKGQRKGGRVEG